MPIDVSELRHLPDEAQIWIMGFDRPLSVEDRTRIEQQLRPFVQSWASHQIPVAGGFQILNDRFVVIAGHCQDGLSGCSMDSCLSNFKTLKTRYRLNALDRSLVFFKCEDQIRSINRVGFQKALSEGTVDSDVVVFDTTLQTLGELRLKGFELPFREAWHARAFRVPVA